MNVDPFCQIGDQIRIIGNPLLLEKELGGGVLLELSHEIDYANWLFGPLISIQAILQHSKTLQIDVEDGAELFLENVNGLIVSIHLDFYCRNPKRECRVFTTKGELVWDLLKQSVLWIDASGQITEKLFQNERDDMFRRQLKHFFNCLKGNSQPMISVEDGVQVIKIIDAARESHSSGRRIKI